MFSLHLEIAYVNTTNNENTPPIQGALYLNLQSITLKRFKHAYEETRNELQTKVKQYNFFFAFFSLDVFYENERNQKMGNEFYFLDRRF